MAKKKTVSKRKIRKVKQTNIENIDITTLLTTDIRNYATHVKPRAIPYVLDTIKQSERRMYQALLKHKTLVKSVKVVSDCMSGYTPHGDSAIYGTLCSCYHKNLPIVTMQGNIGDRYVSLDAAAAMRYTESKISNIGLLLIDDDIKDVVPKVPNYDDSIMEYTFMPIKLPLGVINGAKGVAWGYATNIPGHHPLQVIDAMIAILEHKKKTPININGIIKGPHVRGFSDKYNNKRPHLMDTLANNILSKTVYSIEDGNRGTKQVIITKLPINGDIVRMIDGVKDALKKESFKKGNSFTLTSIEDQTSKDGVRIVMSFKKGTTLKSIKAQLDKFKLTETRVRYSNTFLVDHIDYPIKMTITDILKAFIDNRIKYKKLGLEYKVNQSERRLKILDIRLILANDRELFTTIFIKSKSKELAIKKIIKTFNCDEDIAKSVLGTTYDSTINGSKNIKEEMKKIKDNIKEYKKGLKNIKKYLINELTELRPLIKSEFALLEKPFKRK